MAHRIEAMKKPYKCAKKNDWKGFESFFSEKADFLALHIDVNRNNPFHLAAFSDDSELFTRLLLKLTSSDRSDVLRMKNEKGNTPLHEVAFVGDEKMADCILKSDEAQPNHELLSVKNKLGETPVYMAAKLGRTNMLKFFVEKDVRIEDPTHTHRSEEKKSILHIAIITRNFDTAIWLLEHNLQALASETDDSGMTALQLLATMTSAFKSQFPMSKSLQVLYYLLPSYKQHVRDHVHSVGKEDVESGRTACHNLKDFAATPASRLWYTIWSRLAKEWNGIEELWKKKEMHTLAEDLAIILADEDYSWAPISGSADQTLRGAKEREEGEISEEKHIVYEIPLFIAASKGITEIVNIIIKLHPQSIEHVNEEGQNIMFVAAKHRQREIHGIIKKLGMAETLAAQIDAKGNTLLHHTAYYLKQGIFQSGYAIQLQNELRWFKSVEKRVPAHYTLLRNKKGETPEEISDREHQDLLIQAQKWMKEIAQSCSTVAVLVAGVVFSASFTVPGGTNDEGFPIFLRRPFFKFFAIMDVVSLASSLASLVAFLSILTSDMEMWDFYRILPHRLATGFAFLFFSLATTMLAFGVTILLMLRSEEDRWTSSFIYIAALFPITFLSLVRLPVYVGTGDYMRQMLQSAKVFVPRRLNEHEMARVIGRVRVRIVSNEYLRARVGRVSYKDFKDFVNKTKREIKETLNAKIRGSIRE